LNLIQVQSSNIAAVGYDQVTSTLHVQFKGKEKVYSYVDVLQETFDQMMTADSIGSFYARHIKNVYSSGDKADA
jgi:hypothetical protein